MDKEIISIFDETSAKFLQAVAAFTPDTLNKVPFEKSWTGAQVADHILKSQARLPQMLTGPTKETGRPPEEKKEQLRKVFLDFTTKMKSPDFILPSEEPLNKEILLKRIEEKRKELEAAMQGSELTRTCLDFELPGMGPFTGLEWGWFIIYHTQRHVHQLENILKQI